MDLGGLFLRLERCLATVLFHTGDGGETDVIVCCDFGMPFTEVRLEHTWECLLGRAKETRKPSPQLALRDRDMHRAPFWETSQNSQHRLPALRSQ